MSLVFVAQSENSSLSRLCRMSFSDFLRHYSRIELCTLTPDTIEDDSVKHWSVSKFDGTWRRGSTAGGCRNHPCKFCQRESAMNRGEKVLALSSRVKTYI